MAVRKFTNIFVLLLILMVGSRSILYVIRQKMSPPIIKPVKKKVFINGIQQYVREIRNGL